MARRTSMVSILAQMQRDAQRSARERQRVAQAQVSAQTAAAREAERAQKAYQRALAADEKEKVRLYAESRAAEVESMNVELGATTGRLESLLADTLAVDDHIAFDSLKQPPEIPEFDPGALVVHEAPPIPPNVVFTPPDPPRGAGKILPGAGGKYERAVAAAKEEHDRLSAAAAAEHEAAARAHAEREERRRAQLEEARAAHDEKVQAIKDEALRHHAEVDLFANDFEAGKPDAVCAYFSLVLQSSAYPEGFPQAFKMAFVPESKQLVVEYQLPGLELVPEAKSYKYVRSADRIDLQARPATQRKALYSSVVAQVTLRTLHEVFEADRTRQVETVVLNGFVDTIDPATGKSVQPHLVTVRATRDAFEALDLSKVEPLACLKALNASVSKSPAELHPVRPILDFDMVDPRFVEEADVLSTLDQRPNLMELTPGEFESLITNLFEKMGLDTKLTQASRDGGVDCVAYDPRPIFGGKVVIQAKRYKHTVGVSAVRDLYGTVQNEGASKGILVTTSGFGKASFEFADGKPLELLSGSNLLYLLTEHAGIEAKIEVPEDWIDPLADTADEEPASAPMSTSPGKGP
ncbi:MAG: restriction endonuclease [Actinomycetota bacterium]